MPATATTTAMKIVAPAARRACLRIGATVRWPLDWMSWAGPLRVMSVPLSAVLPRHPLLLAPAGPAVTGTSAYAS